MAIPSGSGTEVLKRAHKRSLGASTYYTILTGVTNHIYTILSLHMMEASGTAGAIRIHLKNGSANETIPIVEAKIVGGEQTFIWNDKIVLSGNDTIQIWCATASSHWWISYIDQDWT
jgi:hypothetical protein